MSSSDELVEEMRVVGMVLIGALLLENAGAEYSVVYDDIVCVEVDGGTGALGEVVVKCTLSFIAGVDSSEVVMSKLSVVINNAVTDSVARDMVCTSLLPLLPLILLVVTLEVFVILASLVLLFLEVTVIESLIYVLGDVIIMPDSDVKGTVVSSLVDDSLCDIEAEALSYTPVVIILFSVDVKFVSVVIVTLTSSVVIYVSVAVVILNINPSIELVLSTMLVELSVVRSVTPYIVVEVNERVGPLNMDVEVDGTSVMLS